MLFCLNDEYLECFSAGQTRLFRNVQMMLLVTKREGKSWGRLGIHFQGGDFFLSVLLGEEGCSSLGFLPYLQGTPALGPSPEMGLGLCLPVPSQA